MSSESNSSSFLYHARFFCRVSPPSYGARKPQFALRKIAVCITVDYISPSARHRGSKTAYSRFSSLCHYSRRRGDSNSWTACAVNTLAGCPFRPLRHVSRSYTIIVVESKKLSYHLNKTGTPIIHFISMCTKSQITNMLVRNNDINTVLAASQTL